MREREEINLDVMKECSIEIMKDFEKMIRDMVANGASADDIAKVTGDTLNAIQKEKTSEKNKRDFLYQELETKFHQHYGKQKLNLDDVGILATLVVAPDYPDWTDKDINEFMTGTVETLKLRAEVVGKGPLDALFTMLDMATDMTQENKDGKKMTNPWTKKADSNGDCACGAGRTCSHSDTRTDTQKVKDFLKQFDF